MLYRKKRPLLVFLLPSLLLMAVFLYYPFVENIVNSLFDIRGLAAARGEASAARRPMPGTWLPWPGKSTAVPARLIGCSGRCARRRAR